MTTDQRPKPESAVGPGSRSRPRSRSLIRAAVALFVLTTAAVTGAAACDDDGESPVPAERETEEVAVEATIDLPEPRRQAAGGDALSVEEAIAQRRSVREYSTAPLTLAELSQLLWAAQGITDPARGYRSAPSAGALYPLELVVSIDRVDSLEPGVYRYLPDENGLALVVDGAVRARLRRDALGQVPVGTAPVTLAFAGVFERTTEKYGERGRRYVFMEVGHAAQNVYLQAEALGLATVVIGAFDDAAIARTLGLRDDERPLYLMPVGRPR